MAQFYSFSVTTPWGETFKIEGAHSFDEAIQMVEKGIHDRKLQREKLGLWVGSNNVAALVGPPPATAPKSIPPGMPGNQTRPDVPDMIKKVDEAGDQVGDIEHPPKPKE